MSVEKSVKSAKRRMGIQSLKSEKTRVHRANRRKVRALLRQAHDLKDFTPARLTDRDIS